MEGATYEGMKLLEKAAADAGLMLHRLPDIPSEG